MRSRRGPWAGWSLLLTLTPNPSPNPNPDPNPNPEPNPNPNLEKPSWPLGGVERSAEGLQKGSQSCRRRAARLSRQPSPGSVRVRVRGRGRGRGRGLGVYG